MIRFKAPQAKMAVSVWWKLIKFGVDWTYMATDKAIIAWLDALPKYVRVDWSKPEAKVEAKVEAKEEVKKDDSPKVESKKKSAKKAKKK